MWAGDRLTDTSASAEDEITMRLGWKQVRDECRAALAVARVLRARGWPGKPRACGPDCDVLRGWSEA